MGAVWMAQQTEPVKRVVALKLIKAGMDSKQVIARFEAERQALALMDHANIARVLDAGTTDAGRPYFVMDLVKGTPITKYCDEHHLTPRQRLELFIPVCQAVQHAHQKGIIHRDLKPSNVIVALYDGKPVPKVIDFGVAKATGVQLTEATLVTGFGNIVGTLEYMSPEQAEINQLDIDTRSDIYSLGVLLYELLAGSPPFSRKDLEKAGMLEMLRVIREQEPSKPSTKLSTAEGLPTLAANRGTDPAKLTKLVRGELDWIVMKALEKDRNRRYETANGFAMDVQRYLADEPVLAGPPSAWYRFRKFARRNRGGLVVSATVGCLLLGLAGLAFHANQQAAERRAEAARQEGEEQGRRSRNAEAVAILLDQCKEALRIDRADRAAIALEAAERRAAEGGAEELADRLTLYRADLKLLRELNDIDKFRWTWVREFPHKNAVAARWRAALADYGVTPDEGRAREMAAKVNGSLVRERILTALDGCLDGDPAAPVRAALGTVLRFADPDAYRNSLRDAIAGRVTKQLAILAEKPEALEQPRWFAAVLGRLDWVNEAHQPWIPANRRRAILESALRTRPGDLHLLMALGGSWRSTEPDGAVQRVRWYTAAVAAHADNMPARINLGLALQLSGDWDGALACFREIIRLDSTVALAHNNVGWILQTKKGDTVGAIAAYESAIRADPKLSLAHGNLGAVFMNKGNLARAAAILGEAVRLDPSDATSYENLGETLLRQKKATDAELALKSCLAIRQKTTPDDWRTFKTMLRLSLVLLEQKKHADAEPLLVNGYEGMKQREMTLPPAERQWVTGFLAGLVEFYEDNGLKAKADHWRKKREESQTAKVNEVVKIGPVHDVGDGLKLQGKLDEKTTTLLYQVKLTAGKTYVIDMISSNQEARDPFLVLKDQEGKHLAEDDDGGIGLNARILYRVPRDGVYRIHATSYNKGRGGFTLTVREMK
jgi:tetratricopeptide (TPR) repeat protein